MTARPIRALPAPARGTLQFGAVLLGALLYLLAAAAQAEPGTAPKGAFTVTLENDAFTNSDNNYTNGLGFSWVSGTVDGYSRDRFVRGWAEFWSFLPFVGTDGYRNYVAWSAAQEMHTPDDIKLADPPLDDQPYAGVLYVDSIIYARNQRWTHAWQMRLGVVGPASRADVTQKWFHERIGADRPMGWDTQLPNEPIVNLAYTGAFLLAEGRAGATAKWRVVPVFNAGLGNYFTGVGAGVYGEIGWNLVDALGGTALRQGLNAASTVGVGPVNGWSVSFSGGLAGYGVAHYLPLDGTVTKDSRSVGAKPFIAMATLGMTARHRNVSVFLGRTYFTETFATERKAPEFGTLSVSWYY